MPYQGLSPQSRRPNQHDQGVSKLLTQSVLDTSGLASGSSTPKRPGPLALATLLPLRLEDSTKPVDTSSQVSIPDDLEMDDPTLEEIHASLSLPVETPGPSSRAPSVMLIRGNKYQILGWPFTKMSQRSLRPSRKQRPSVPRPSGTWRPAEQ